MNFKKLRRYISAILLMPILCTSVASAKTFSPIPGERTYVLKSNEIVSLNKVTQNGDKLIFVKDGRAEFDFVLPFASEYIEVSYEKIASPVNVSITIDDERTYTGTLSKDATTCTIPVKEFYGSRRTVIKTSEAVTITAFTFHDINWIYPAHCLVNADQTDYEYTISNSVVIYKDASAMKSKGAFRWFDIDDRFVTPKNINGSLYVPLSTFAIEMGLYCEDYADKNYLLLAGETKRLILFGGKGYTENALGERCDAELNVFYEKGVTWVPIRKLAELFDFHVAYRDGYAVIDDRLTAESIVNNEAFFTELKTEMSAYIPPSRESVKGTTYHVSKAANASDSNPGTESAPFLTLNKAGAVAKAGDTVIVHEGTYREIFTPQNDGTLFAPITFRAAEGEKAPVISALEELTSMVENKETGFWNSQLENPLKFGRNQLFYNGKALVEGRHPNKNTHPTHVARNFLEGYDPVWPIAGDMHVRKQYDDYATSNIDLLQPEGYWEGGTFITFKGEAWTMVSGDIVSSSPGRINLKEHEQSRSYSLGLQPSEAHYYKMSFFTEGKIDDFGYITNHVHTIDLPGEWCIDKNGLLTVMAPNGAKINEGFEVKARQRVINLNNRKYITLDGIDTIGGGMTLHGEATEGCVLTNGHFEYLSHTTRYTDPQGGYLDTDVPLTGEGPVQWGELGIYISGKQNVMTNCRIDYSAGFAVRFEGLYGYLYNCEMYNCGYMPGYLTPILIGHVPGEAHEKPRGGHTIVYNTVKYASRGGLCLMGGEVGEGLRAYTYIGNEIAYNKFEHYGIGTADTGGFYWYGANIGTDKTYTRAHHNIFGPHVISAIDHRSITAALYSDGWTTGGYGYQNLSFNVDEEMKGNNMHYRHANEADVATHWFNNRALGWGLNSLDEVQVSDYPDGWAFSAGSLNGERFMMNYDELTSGVEHNYLPVKTDNIKAEDGTVTAKTFAFENVNLPQDGFNNLTLYSTVDGIETYERIKKITAVVKDSTGTEVANRTYDCMVPGNNWFEPEVTEICIALPRLSKGNYDIDLIAQGDRVTVHRLRADKLINQEHELPEYNPLDPVSYDEVRESCPNGDGMKTHVPPVRTIEGENKEGLMNSFTPTGLGWTWDHTFIYRDRVIDKDYTGIEFRWATGWPVGGSVVELYADNMNNDPIATFTADQHPESHIAWPVQTIKLDFEEPLKAGKHTFYLKFNGCGKTCTIYGMNLIADEK